jgi:isopenicillin-N N-acyltransferase like protein
VFAHYAGWDWPRVREEAHAFERPIADYGGGYLAELGGIAEGAGLPFVDVLAINVRTEVMYAATARRAAALHECSGVAVLPQAQAEGRTVLGQNWDWLLHSLDTVVVLEAHRDDGPDYVTVVEAGLLAKTGLNSSGLAVAPNALATDADLGQPAVPFHVILRAILDGETISDGLGAIQRSRRSSSANYLLAHEDGMAVSVEAAPGDFSRVFLLFPEDGLLLHTNHFRSPAFDGKDVSLWAGPDSPFRLERLRQQLPPSRAIAVEDLQRTFSDHANEPSSVCCHPDPRSPLLERGTTGASVVMELDTRRLWLADGPPCENPYRELDYREFLSKPSPLRTRA